MARDACWRTRSRSANTTRENRSFRKKPFSLITMPVVCSALGVSANCSATPLRVRLLDSPTCTALVK